MPATTRCSTPPIYPGAVAHDQRQEFIARENYLDYSAGDFDFRFGRQHIVWGEVVGLFFADVVSAKDLREFVLPDFDLIRIPQWAARAEYFKNDFHAEAVWIPVMSYDKIGKPGADFFPYPPPPPPGYGVAFENEVRPGNSVSNGAYGGRMSYLKNGWDGSVFYHRSFDANPTFYRQIVADPVPLLSISPGMTASGRPARRLRRTSATMSSRSKASIRPAQDTTSRV